MRYVVVMEGVTGEFRTPCESEAEALELARHDVALGWDAWVEIETEGE